MGSAAPPPGKMDEKLVSKNMQKKHFSVLQNTPFVVKFSKFSPQAAWGQ